MKRAFQALGPAHSENMAASSGTRTVSTSTMSAVGSRGEEGAEKPGGVMEYLVWTFVRKSM